MSTFIPSIFKITALSPIYIGIGKDREWQEGMDFIEVADQKAIVVGNVFEHLDSNEMSKLSSSIINGRTQEISQIALKSLNKSNSKLVIPSHYPLQNNPVNSFIRTGQGIPYIPGSTIKGSIATILSRSISANFQDISKVLGGISDSPMRLVRVSDAMPLKVTTEVAPMKVVIADTSTHEGIRYKTGGRGGRETRFIAHHFPNFCEFVSEKSEFVFKYNSLSESSSKFFKIDSDNITNGKKVLELSKVQNLIETFKKRTRNYLKKEIQFFDSFEFPSSEKWNGENYSEVIVKQLNDLLIQNNKENAFVMRMGNGQGKHNIQGDVSNSHLLTKQGIEWESNSSFDEEELANKSRKIVFKREKEGNYPLLPGFVLIQLTDEQSLKSIIFEVETDGSAIQEIPISEPEPIKAVHFDEMGVIDFIPVVIKKFENNVVFFEPMVENFPANHSNWKNKDKHKLRYPGFAGLNVKPNEICLAKIEFDNRSKKDFTYKSFKTIDG